MDSRYTRLHNWKLTGEPNKSFPSFTRHTKITIHSPYTFSSSSRSRQGHTSVIALSRSQSPDDGRW